MTTPLDTLRALEQAATPGPWDYSPLSHTLYCGFTVRFGEGLPKQHRHSCDPTGELVSALRNLAPELLALWEAGNRFRACGLPNTSGLVHALDALAKEVLPTQPKGEVDR